MLSLVLLFAVGFLSAQELTCAQRESLIDQHVKDTRYAEAVALLEDRGKCRLTSETALNNIEKAVLYLIENKTGDEKTALISKLATYYGQASTDLPALTTALQLRKVLLLHRHKSGTPEEWFGDLDRAYKSDPLAFNDPKAVQLYFSLYVDRFKSGKYKLSDTDLFTFHDDLLQHIRKGINSQDQKTSRSFQAVLNNIRSTMAPLVNCEKLNAFYASGLKQNAENARWLENATSALSGARCTTDTLFTSISERWYAVQPGAQSAYQAAVAALRRNDRARAVTLFDASAEFEASAAEKAKIYYTVASSLASSDKPLAMQYVQKSLKVQSTYAKSYLLMAQLTAGADGCWKNEFEKKALSLLAAQLSLKAGEMDPSLKYTAERQAELYRKYSPTMEEIKAAKMQGKTLKFDCWLSTSVTLPK